MGVILVVALVLLAQGVISNVDIECPSTGQDFHEHTSSCSKFYECNNGVLAEVDCINGLHFNPNKGFCDFPDNVGCTIEEEVEGVCPDAGQNFYPHPTSCSKFYECNDGTLAEVECIPGLQFNPETGFCDFPENVNCESEESSSEDGGTAEPGPVGECPVVNEEFVTFLTHSTDCTKFYMCNWGTPIEQNCPSGLHFNPTINVCDWPTAAGCELA